MRKQAHQTVPAQADINFERELWDAARPHQRPPAPDIGLVAEVLSRGRPAAQPWPLCSLSTWHLSTGDGVSILQEIFDQVLDEELSSQNLLFWFILRITRDRGIQVTEEQEKEIRRQLDRLDTDSLIITFDEDQVPFIRGEDSVDEVITLDWSDEEVDGFLKDISGALAELVPGAIEELSTEIYHQLKKDAPSMLRAHRRDRRAYSKDVSSTWRRPLDLLESHIQICVEAGSEFVAETAKDASIEQPLVFGVLARLHARACRVANEVLCLLSNGYSNGAHARWRSLHEISTVVAFIAEHDDELAERYTLHQGIDSYRAAEQYQKHCGSLGSPPLDKGELQAIAARFNELKKRFGEDYAKPHGWGAKALGMRNPRFVDIASAVGLDHLRPFYKMASYSVHADPKGIFFNLALFPWEGDMLLAGPSFAGLADPGQSTAISLGQITTRLLLVTEPNIDRLVLCHVLFKYMDAIAKEFVELQSELEQPPAT